MKLRLCANLIFFFKQTHKIIWRSDWGIGDLPRAVEHQFVNLWQRLDKSEVGTLVECGGAVQQLPPPIVLYHGGGHLNLHIFYGDVERRATIVIVFDCAVVRQQYFASVRFVCNRSEMKCSVLQKDGRE
jgi:hypothetical protein